MARDVALLILLSQSMLPTDTILMNEYHVYIRASPETPEINEHVPCSVCNWKSKRENWQLNRNMQDNN
jgi:hypothetical protein